jgi:hypothetical protein
MHKDLIDLLLFLEFPVLLGLAAKRLAPCLRAFWVASSQLNHTFDLLNLFAHACVQLYFHSMQVEVDVLSETDKESQWLLNATLLCEVVACCQLLKMLNLFADLLIEITPFVYFWFSDPGQSLETCCGNSLS